LKLSPTLKIRDVHLLPQLARENEPVLFGLPTVKGSTRAPSKGQGNDFSEMWLQKAGTIKARHTKVTFISAVFNCSVKDQRLKLIEKFHK
jgi:hypothetical protein